MVEYDGANHLSYIENLQRFIQQIYPDLNLNFSFCVSETLICFFVRDYYFDSSNLFEDALHYEKSRFQITLNSLITESKLKNMVDDLETAIESKAIVYDHPLHKILNSHSMKSLRHVAFEFQKIQFECSPSFICQILSIAFDLLKRTISKFQDMGANGFFSLNSLCIFLCFNSSISFY